MSDPAESGAMATLIDGLRAVCPAVVSGGSPDWSTADAAYTQLSGAGGAPDGGCYGRVGFEVLRVLVTAHREDPETEFHIAEDGPGGGGCQAPS
ncbi:hypothetical protein [Streptomyces sp. MST-110588]|uniref:hypothetical protein n=1 Tax=Streptomyces sp. MST-110588 TaxID=2833628 RepID=UPI001F5DCBCF|nr:hypothetical protein [Streptomyces sp. MST-110588]UNO41445.1 hypothetical protein KGS77_20075 [Streptomyces sp. MST-110588]